MIILIRLLLLMIVALPMFYLAMWIKHDGNRDVCVPIAERLIKSSYWIVVIAFGLTFFVQ